MTRLIANRAVCVFAVLALALGAHDTLATNLSQTVLDVMDVNPDPNVFEASLSVDEQDVNINGTTVHTLIYKDVNNPGAYAGTPNGIPIPQIVVNVGDEIIVTLTNDLSNPCAAIACDTSIHWHGLELDNDSDGTGVTQNHLAPGETYTYRFKTFRPGIFWFHPHMKPGPQLFAGTYAAFIVKDPNEAVLAADAKIPAAANTHTVVLSDIEFDGDGDVGYLEAGNATPWATLHADCAAGAPPSCRRVMDAATVLVNGQKPDAVTETPMITAMSGAGIRLRLVNASTHRYFLLSVSGNGTDNNLYRIGGEGGFLEHVRLEGGTLGSWDTKYAEGQILLPASARADVVIVPTGNNGDVITISGIGYNRGGPSNMSSAGDLLYIEIDNTLADIPFVIAEGNDVLGAGGVEDIKSIPIALLDSYLETIPMLPGPGSGLGSSDETITLSGIVTGQLGIDGIQGHFEDSGDDYTQVPYQETSRYARTGDTLEITIAQNTCQHHPFHHHGFSFQPVRILDAVDDSVLYEFDYNEFVDVIDVPVLTGPPPCTSSRKVVIRVRLDDKPRITDNRQEAGAPAPNQFFASGGAAGRWVFHCHMFLHAAIGMISELVVVDTDRDGDGFDTSMDCDDFDPNNFPGNVEICDTEDNDCDMLVDDADPSVLLTTWFADADGDGDGDPTVTQQACAMPVGFVASGDDCAPGDPNVYSGAPEINDGGDNQCSGDPGFGSVDEISGVAGFFNPADADEFSWPPQSGATLYRVARSGRADFSDATATFTTTATAWSDPTQPAPGGCLHYMARSLSPFAGSWGQSSSGVERAVNVLVNGGMEDWDSATDPAAWLETTSGGTVDEEVDPPNVNGGLRAARLTRTGSGVLNIVNPGLPLLPGQSYSLSFQAKFSEALAGAVQVRIRNQTRGEDLQDAGTWSTSTNFLRFDLTTEYQLHELPFSVDPGHDASDDFRVILRQHPSAQIGAELWLDDVRIDE